MSSNARLAGLHAKQRRQQLVREKKNMTFHKRANTLPFSHPLNLPRVAIVFGPLEAILDDLGSTGDIDAMPDGTPLIKDNSDGRWCPIAPALVSMCDVYSKLSRTHGWNDDRTEGVRQLAKRFEDQAPVFQEDLDAARASLTWMKQRTFEITPEQYTAESIEVQVRDEFRARETPHAAG
jgi:hypothetical protein